MKYTRLATKWPLLVASALLAALGSCTTPEEVPPPKELLPKEKLVSVLVQLHLLEARVEASRLAVDTARAVFQQQKSELLWKNNVSEKDSVLQHSFRYYAVNRKDMDEIYKAVIDSLEQRRATLSGEKKPDHPW